jgi:hypothetical protein
VSSTGKMTMRKMCWKTRVKGPVGRWEDNIKTDFREIVFGDMDWIDRYVSPHFARSD